MNSRRFPSFSFPAKASAKTLAALIATSALLTACGGGSSQSTEETSDEHEHTGRLLFSLSDSDTLMVFDQEESAFESVEDSAAGNAATLVLADNGLSAAVLSNGIADFVYSGLHSEEEEEALVEAEGEHGHEEAELLSLSLDSVTAMTSTEGHFSLLRNGSTVLLPAEDLEDSGLAFENTTGPASQTYPGLLLEEEHELMLFFAADKAQVYEAGAATGDEFSCTNPAASVQGTEFALVLCDEGVLTVKVEETETDHEIDSDTLTALSSATQVRSNGHDFAAFSADGLWLIHEDDNETLQPESVNLTGVSEICNAAFATEDEETLAVLNSAGYLHIIDAESAEETRIALDETVTTNLSCDALALANGPEGFMVVDKNDGILYIIDAHDGSPYHVHSRYQDNALTTLADVVLMHAIDAEHAHEH